MKKILSVALFLSFVLILSTISYANNSELKIKMSADSSNIKLDKIIELNIELLDFVDVDTKKPMAAEGTLIYDESLFESVTAAGKNGWVATLNGKKFLLDVGSISEGNIATFKFKLKDEADFPDVITFGVTGFSITNDADIDYDNLTLEETKVIYNTNQNIQSSEEKNDNTTTTYSDNANIELSNQNQDSQVKNDTDNKVNVEKQDIKNENNIENTEGTIGTESKVETTEEKAEININSKTEESDKAVNYTKQEIKIQQNESKTISSNTESTPKIDKVADVTVNKVEVLPKTGESQVIIISVCTLIAIGIFGFVRYKLIKI